MSEAQRGALMSDYWTRIHLFRKEQGKGQLDHIPPSESGESDEEEEEGDPKLSASTFSSGKKNKY